MGTFGSATFAVNSPYFIAKNITFKVIRSLCLLSSQSIFQSILKLDFEDVEKQTCRTAFLLSLLEPIGVREGFN